jgi:hypothetical protein
MTLALYKFYQLNNSNKNLKMLVVIRCFEYNIKIVYNNITIYYNIFLKYALKFTKNLFESAYGDWAKVGRAKSGFGSDRWPNPHKRINGCLFYSSFGMPTIFYTSINLGKVILSGV